MGTIGRIGVFGAGDFEETGMGSVVHTYIDNEDYTVRLTVTGPGGTHTREREEYIHIAPYANFTTKEPLLVRTSVFSTPTTFDIYSGDTPVVFSNLTDPAAVHVPGAPTLGFGWLWKFGDGLGGSGDTSTQRSPIHSYDYDDRYTISLTAIGPGGTFTETKEEYVIFPPVANFDITPSVDPNGYGTAEGKTVTFTAWSDKPTVGEIDRWDFDFGDPPGGSISPLVFDISHTYPDLQAPPSTDSYNIFNEAFSEGGPHPDESDTSPTQSVTVVRQPRVSASCGSATDFESGCASAGASCSMSGIIDGGCQWSSGPSFTCAGTYSATVTVLGPGGTDSAGCTVVINPYPYPAPPPPPPPAAFVMKTIPAQDLSVQNWLEGLKLFLGEYISGPTNF